MKLVRCLHLHIIDKLGFKKGKNTQHLCAHHTEHWKGMRGELQTAPHIKDIRHFCPSVVTTKTPPGDFQNGAASSHSCVRTCVLHRSGTPGLLPQHKAPKGCCLRPACCLPEADRPACLPAKALASLSSSSNIQSGSREGSPSQGCQI